MEGLLSVAFNPEGSDCSAEAHGHRGSWKDKEGSWWAKH